MRPPWHKLAAGGFLAFLALWAAGGLRGSSLAELRLGDAAEPAWPSSQNRQEFNASVQVANNLRTIGLAKTPLPAVLDHADVERIHVHEKTAHVGTATTAFDEAEAAVRAIVAGAGAEVLNERSGGIAPRRRLALEIGVHPDRFDALVEQLRGVGRLEAVSVQQVDRTGAFRRLHAQRQSLKKHLVAVLKLRGEKAPSIEDTLRLEQRIQEIEKEMQALAVQLGDLLGKESFYHVHLTLSERPAGDAFAAAAGLLRRALHAFAWALVWWGVLAAAVVLVGATALSVKALWPTRG